MINLNDPLIGTYQTMMSENTGESTLKRASAAIKAACQTAESIKADLTSVADAVCLYEDRDSNFAFFQEGFELAVAANGRTVWHYESDSDVYMFIGTEIEVCQGIRSAPGAEDDNFEIEDEEDDK